MSSITQVSGRLQCAAFAPLVPADGPVAVLRQRQRRSAAVADLDHVAGYRKVEEPFRVVGVEVQAAVRRVAVSLGPYRRVELVQIYAVTADLGGPVDGLAVSEPGVFGQAKGRGVHDDGIALIQ